MFILTVLRPPHRIEWKSQQQLLLIPASHRQLCEIGNSRIRRRHRRRRRRRRRPRMLQQTAFIHHTRL